MRFEYSIRSIALYCITSHYIAIARFVSSLPYFAGKRKHRGMVKSKPLSNPQHTVYAARSPQTRGPPLCDPTTTPPFQSRSEDLGLRSRRCLLSPPPLHHLVRLPGRPQCCQTIMPSRRGYKDCPGAVCALRGPCGLHAAGETFRAC